MHGIAATRAIREAHPSIAVLVVAMFDDDSVFAAMWAGTRGYLLKGADADEMVRAIRAIAHGEAIFSPSVAQQLMGSSRHFAYPHRPCDFRSSLLLTMLKSPAGIASATLAQMRPLKPALKVHNQPASQHSQAVQTDGATE
jgi:DNA-binding NarL/FixJ family response regulator